MSSATRDGKTFIFCTFLCGLLLLLLAVLSSDLSALWIMFGMTYILLSLKLYYFLLVMLMGMLSDTGGSPLMAATACLVKILLFFILIFVLLRLEAAEFLSVLVGVGSFIPGALLFAAFSAFGRRRNKKPL